MIKRTVDLGREEELVTWDEWFGRSIALMKEAIPDKFHDRLAFRVGLADGRSFGVKQVIAHVARGACTIGPSRWNDREAVCDVVTGYMLMGAGEDEIPSALCVSPVLIISVECVLAPEPEEDSSATPFGFYKREGIDVPVERKEVEEKFTYVNAEGSD
ncbi:MAG: hypothetical protein JNK58_01865 [Phycisphaerae bacterium]|nr:hypothetical protein [Phycisphaerae bacterium]